LPERSPPRRPEEMSVTELRERLFDSPLRARSLLTVRAAISSARDSEAPCSRSLCLTYSYCLARLVPFFTPRGGIGRLLCSFAPTRSVPEPIGVKRSASGDPRRVVGPGAAGEKPCDTIRAVGAQEHLRVDARRTDERVVLHLTGELDLASSPIFERALEDADVASAPLLVLDLDELKFVDSTGLRVILLAHEGSRARGQEFAITPGSPQVQRLLSITSVAEHMRVLSTPDDPAA
jgi:anti-anti-sigma factor